MSRFVQRVTMMVGRVGARCRRRLRASRSRHAHRRRPRSVRCGAAEGAKVTVTSLATGVATTVTTRTTGVYLVVNLAPGEYLVQVEATGFQRFEQTVSLELGARSRLDMSLAVGSIGETVTVEGVTPLLSTEIRGARHRGRPQRNGQAAAGDPQLGRPAGDGARRAERPLHRAGRRHLGGPHRRRQRARQSQPAEQLPARRRRQQQLLDQRAGADHADCRVRRWMRSTSSRS